ncbi:19846_t:CDS:10 [Entrophospora sp. SA101]|nr:19846_t:CDS:10 [Entrophospora sp. SA101]
MFLEGFRLQIFVNGEPLKEYSEKYRENKTITTTVYAAVCKSDENKRFSINFGYTKAKYSTPLKAYLFVDGVWDYTYYQIYDNCYYVEDGFWNQERDKKFYFEFFTSNMNNDIIGSGSKRRRGRIERKGGKDVINGDDNVEKTSRIESKGKNKRMEKRVDEEEDMDYAYNIHKDNNINDLINHSHNQREKSKKYTGGGPGTISVHFYKAEWHEYGVVKVPGFDVSQQKDHIKETAISTGFKESKLTKKFITKGFCSLKRLSDQPIAVLNLEYRDISYLNNINGLIIPNNNSNNQELKLYNYNIKVGLKRNLPFIEDNKTKVRSKLPDRNKVTKKFDPKDINLPMVITTEDTIKTNLQVDAPAEFLGFNKNDESAIIQTPKSTIDELSELLSNNLISTNKTTFRAKNYKASPLLTRSKKETQEERRKQALEEQKRVYNSSPKIADLLTKPIKRRFEVEQDDDENNDKISIKKARHKVMHAEWMYELPNDLEENWYVVLCPVGKRCLVTSAKGNTMSRLRNGGVMDVFESNLPAGGSNYKGNKTTDYCILDCVYDQATFTFYVLDMMCWKGHPIYDCDTEFRFYWLTTKFNEVDPPITAPSLGTMATVNNSIYKFIPLSPLNCSPKQISSLISDSNPFGYRSDGLLFFNKQTQYVIGETPLCGWIGIEKVKEILGNYLNCDQQLQQKSETKLGEDGCE